MYIQGVQTMIQGCQVGVKMLIVLVQRNWSIIMELLGGEIG